MGIVDKMKSIFIKQADYNLKEPKQEKFEIVLNDIDRCALYIKSKDKYIFIKDKNFPFMLNNIDLGFIEINKNNFEYYEEFSRLDLMIEKILEIENKEIIDKKTEESYLVDYLEHSSTDYLKIIEKMKTFEIDKIRYDKLISSIKDNIREKIDILYNHQENSNSNLETNRTYKEIMSNLITSEEFFKKYPYQYYKDIQYKEDTVCHCGYPDYMWQSGAERNIYTFKSNT